MGIGMMRRRGWRSRGFEGKVDREEGCRVHILGRNGQWRVYVECTSVHIYYMMIH